MPSWPARLLSGSSFPSSSSLPPPYNPQTENFASASQEQETLNDRTPLHGVPVLQQPPLTGSVASPSQGKAQTRHGRSISHPFPTIFGSGKKLDSKPENKANGTEAETPDAQLVKSGHGSPINTTVLAAQKGPASSTEKDFTTGRCATCDSMVRWPRHLQVYRCTVCLMINDLKPATRDHGIVEQSSPHLSGIFKDERAARKPLNLSLETTKSLIDQSLVLYLQFCLDRETFDDRQLSQATSGEKHPSPAIPDFQNNIAQSDRIAFKTVNLASENLESRREGPGREKPSQRDFKSGNLTSPQPAGQAVKGSPTNVEGRSSTVIRPPTRQPPPPPSRSSEKPATPTSETPEQLQSLPTKTIFRRLENYLVACMSDCECINASFSVLRPSPPTRAASEGMQTMGQRPVKSESWIEHESPLSEVDAKTLLLGDFAENGMWWAGARVSRNRSQKGAITASEGLGETADRVSLKSPRIHWEEVNEWYQTILSCGRSWRRQWKELQTARKARDPVHNHLPWALEQRIDEEIAESRLHLQRTLLRASEDILRRPGRPLKTPEDCRFLFIILVNPLLYSQSSHVPKIESRRSQRSTSQDQKPISTLSSYLRESDSPKSLARIKNGGGGQHSGIVKRMLGLMSNTPNECHRYFISWFSRFSEPQFRKVVEFVGGFVTYRLTRQQRRQYDSGHGPTSSLIPVISGPGAGTSAHLHAALGLSGASKAPETKDALAGYSEDWQIKAAAKVMSLLFSANSSGSSRRQESTKGYLISDVEGSGFTTQQRANRHGQLLPTSDFYNTLLDYADLVTDFEAWESRRGKFSFCQYPMFLSIWAKIHIMEHDARRQMEVKAREAFFNSIISRKAVSQYLVLKVRRECLVEDSLRGVSEVVGAGQEEIKKGLRIEFLGEEGVDAGGLRKEWFLLLVREVFDPDHGLFVYDEDSRYCYFNPSSFETSDQFFLVGVVFGLAIYNSTILDVAFPPFAFRKLLASAPAYHGPSTTSPRPSSGYSLEDLAEFQPSLAHGLRQLLTYEGDVEQTFCRDFVAEVERYGELTYVPLCSNGASRAVNNRNRREFVDLYIQYLLDTSVVRQYEPFKRGFFSVCGGNALSLFRPEEIELLVRGSDEPLDVASLRAVAIYENWGPRPELEQESLIVWFWEFFAAADMKSQRRVLSFITGSDRIPAMGATNLVIKITCLGDDHDRFPIARTCFNMIGLYRYRTREELETKLWRAVVESEGFGLK